MDAEFVAADGSFFSLNQKSAPNVFAFARNGAPIPGICTSASVKLYAVMPDETAALAIIENPAAGKIYHISSATPSSMETLAGYTERFLALKGLRVVYQSRDKNPLLNPALLLFDN